MGLWSRRPDLRALESQRDVSGLLGASGVDSASDSQIVGALVRLARREGLCSSSTHNEAAAAALLSLGAWRELVSFYDEYRPPEHDPIARGVFVITLTRLLGEFAVRTRTLELALHLLIGASFRFEELGWHPFTGGSRLLRDLVAVLEAAEATDALEEVRASAAEPAARQEAGLVLGRLRAAQSLARVESGSFTLDEVIDSLLTRGTPLGTELHDPALEALVARGHQETVQLLAQVAGMGLETTLIKTGRREMLQRFRALAGTDEKALQRRVQKYFRRLVHTPPQPVR